MSVELGVQGPGRRQVVAEGLLHRDPGSLGETGAGQAFHYAAEQRRRDLEIEDGAGLPLDGAGDAVIGLRVLVVARDHRQAPGQPLENVLADLLAGVLDGLACVVPEGRGRPLAAGYADDRAPKLPAALQAIQGPEGLFFRQIPGDAEDHQDSCGRGRLCGHVIPLSWPLRLVRPLSWVTSVPSMPARSIRIAILPPGWSGESRSYRGLL
jgi:hypothetical protein